MSSLVAGETSIEPGMRQILSALLSLVWVFPAMAAEKTVRDFGAVGDGKSDDTAAIQKAAASGAIIFPAGSYRLTAPIRVALSDSGPLQIRGEASTRVIMAAAGPAFHVVGTHTGTAAPASVKPHVWEKERTPSVSNLEIVGDHAEADGI